MDNLRTNKLLLMKNKTLILIAFILIKFLLQYSLIHPEYDLHRDEFLHLDQAKHLAWGYVSVPPFTSWISYIIYLLGGSVFWVKFFPALFGALTMIAVWKTVETLGGNLYALIVASTGILLSAVLRINTLYQPNSFDILCWTAFYFFLIRYCKEEKTKHLFYAALIFAFGFLNKYNIAFLLIGLFPAVLFSPHRKVFAKPAFYLALLLALIIVLPNLWWQIANHFPVIHHMKELQETQLVNVSRMSFLSDQLLFFIGSLVVMLAGFFALAFYQPFRKYQFFLLAFIFTILVFLVFRAKSYYTIGLYPVYLAFGSVYLEKLFLQYRLKYLQPVVVLMQVVLFIPLSRVAFPDKTPEFIIKHQERYQQFGLLRWEDGKDHLLPQDFADMLGWKQLAQKVDSVAAGIDDLDKTLVLCDNYGQAGAINFYKTNKQIEAFSFNADYLNWMPTDKMYKHVLLIKEKEDDDPQRNKEKPIFDSVYLAAQRINQFAREDTIAVYVLKNANIDIRPILRDEVQKRSPH